MTSLVFNLRTIVRAISDSSREALQSFSANCRIIGSAADKVTSWFEGVDGDRLRTASRYNFVFVNTAGEFVQAHTVAAEMIIEQS